MRTSRLLLSVMFGFLVLGLASPVYAQEAAAGAAAGSGLVQWSIITAGFALAIAAAGAALGQGKAVASAAEAIARNPGAAGEIRARCDCAGEKSTGQPELRLKLQRDASADGIV